MNGGGGYTTRFLFGVAHSVSNVFVRLEYDAEIFTRHATSPNASTPAGLAGAEVDAQSGERTCYACNVRDAQALTVSHNWRR